MKSLLISYPGVELYWHLTKGSGWNAAWDRSPLIFSQGCLFEGARQFFGLAQIPLKPLESLRVYQAPGSAVCKAGWRAVVRSQPGGEDSYCEGAQRAGSHSATETLCLCMERSALISRLYWRHTLPVSNLYCWFSLHSCRSPSQSCCFLVVLFFLMEIR